MLRGLTPLDLKELTPLDLKETLTLLGPQSRFGEKLLGI